MTHDELREVVATAISAGTLAWDDGHVEVWETHRAAADAAIATVWEALREPDAGMHEAGFKESIGGKMGEWMPEGFPAINAAIYRAMLAASPLRPTASAEGVG